MNEKHLWMRCTHDIKNTFFPTYTTEYIWVDWDWLWKELSSIGTSVR